MQNAMIEIVPQRNAQSQSEFKYSTGLPVFSDAKMEDGKPTLRVQWATASLGIEPFMEHFQDEPEANEFPYRYKYFDTSPTGQDFRISGDQMRDWHNAAVDAFAKNRSGLNGLLAGQTGKAVAALDYWEKRQAEKKSAGKTVDGWDCQI